MFGSRLLSGLNLRRRFRSNRRQSRRQTGYRPDVVAETSRLEDRALMSTFEAWGYLWSNEYRNNLAGTGWYSSDQQWAPQNAGKLGNHLFLRLSKETVDGYTAMSSGELDLVGKIGWDGKPVQPWHPGYGTYLVVAHTPGGFSKVDSHGIKNVNFGVFTYQKDADSSQRNSHRELDMAEVGRFNDQVGGPTNAQFTLQPAFALHKPDRQGVLYAAYPNIHRFTIPENPNYITLVMQWDGPNRPVNFRQYSGVYTLENYLRARPDNTWTTEPDQNPFIPNNGDQTLHLNLWRSGSPQVFGPDQNPNLTVDIVYFQYKPL